MSDRNEAPRAIGYVRVSSAGQAERGMSLAAQRERVKEYAKANGYQLVDVVEEAASAAVRDGDEVSYERRPVLLGLIDRAERGEYDVLVVPKYDRLSRDYASLIMLKRRLKKADVELVSVAEDNGDSPVAEMMQGIISVVAEYEGKLIKERVKFGRAIKKERGLHVGGGIPYGYTTAAVDEADRKGRTLEPVEAEAATVDRIFRAAAAGQTPGKIAKALNDDGIAGPDGRQWNRTTIRNIIENPAYTGELHGIKKTHRAIVSKRLWNAAAAGLAARTKPTA
jgi:site-specific DNA recombinase